MRDFLLGVSYLPRGFRLLWEPGLRRYVVGPVAINIVVFLLLFWLAGAQFQHLLAWLLPDPSAFSGDGIWQQTLRFLTATAYWLLWPLFILIAAVVMLYSFTLVANLIGSPFNGMLSARVEHMISGTAPPDQGLSLATEAWHSVTGELRKYAYLLKLALPLMVLFFIPGINLIASLLWALFGAWAIALEYLDYPMGNHGYRFREERGLLARNRALSLGFGAGMLAMTLIPGVNLLAMPTGVIAATLLWTEQGRRITATQPASRQGFDQSG
jgi:CysZ protein